MQSWKYYGALAWLLLAMGCSATEETVDCDNAQTTLHMNECAQQTLGVAQQQLQQYLNAAYAHNKDDTELVAAIGVAQTQWKAYANAHCESIYTQWRDGSIRNLMALSCRTELTHARTHELWSNFLTYMDSSPAVLPEPKL